MQNTNPIERLAYTLIFGLLFITVIIEWKIAKFTGAWIFFIPIVVIAISGWSVFSTILLVLSFVFCIFRTIRSINRLPSQRSASPSEQEASIWNRLES